MSLALETLDACFEGVVPSIIATVGPDGAPNISYLSHVARVDETHVALSNQFFGKTASNLRTNPHATILLVDGRTGRQVRLEALFVESVENGELFERVAAQLSAGSAQVGMAETMRLRALDIFRVTNVSLPPSLAVDDDVVPRTPSLLDVAEVVEAIAEAPDVAGVVDAALDGLRRGLGYEAAMLLLHDAPRDVLTTVSSRGYGRQGVGSELAFGQGVIGTAAAKRRLVKVSDLSRVARFGTAIRNTSTDENQTRSIPLPGLPGGQSQMAVPILTHGLLHGVIAAESARRLAFQAADEAALALIARQVGASLALAEAAASVQPEPARATPVATATSGSFRVTCHAYDDSVFIDDSYIIKGVAGRLLMFLLQKHRAEGRVEFTNRELRRTPELRLPEFKDNLEARLLLLRRRLEEKAAPVRLLRTGRGRLRLELDGIPEIAASTASC